MCDVPLWAAIFCSFLSGMGTGVVVFLVVAGERQKRDNKLIGEETGDK
jgi:hypothetical protein